MTTPSPNPSEAREETMHNLSRAFKSALLNAVGTLECGREEHMDIPGIVDIGDAIEAALKRTGLVLTAAAPITRPAITPPDALAQIEALTIERDDAWLSAMDHFKAENDQLRSELAAAKRDGERLDSGCIVINTRDEFGEPYRIEHRGMDLRKAIDAAIEQGGRGNG